MLDDADDRMRRRRVIRAEVAAIERLAHRLARIGPAEPLGREPVDHEPCGTVGPTFAHLPLERASGEESLTERREVARDAARGMLAIAEPAQFRDAHDIVYCGSNTLVL